jgi:Flp pilus assembly protein CpaB
MTYRVRNIGIAVALAAIAALLTSVYVTSYKRHVQSGQDQVTVYVAKQDIPLGTTGGEAAKMLSTQQVPKRTLVPGAITKPDQLTGLTATQPTLQGEQVTTRRFSTVSRSGVRADLTGTDRAFEFSGDQTQLLAGTLHNGDHVDLVASLSCGGNSGDCGFTRVVLRNLKVLQAPASPGGASSKLTSNQDFNVMLKMTDSQSQKFQHVLWNDDHDPTASWRLVMRPVTHDADSPESITTNWTIFRDGLSPSWIKRYLRALKGGQ